MWALFLSFRLETGVGGGSMECTIFAGFEDDVLPPQNYALVRFDTVSGVGGGRFQFRTIQWNQGPPSPVKGNVGAPPPYLQVTSSGLAGTNRTVNLYFSCLGFE